MKTLCPSAPCMCKLCNAHRVCAHSQIYWGHRRKNRWCPAENQPAHRTRIQQAEAGTSSILALLSQRSSRECHPYGPPTPFKTINTTAKLRDPNPPGEGDLVAAGKYWHSPRVGEKVGRQAPRCGPFLSPCAIAGIQPTEHRVQISLGFQQIENERAALLRDLLPAEHMFSAKLKSST